MAVLTVAPQPNLTWPVCAIQDELVAWMEKAQVQGPGLCMTCLTESLCHLVDVQVSQQNLSMH